MSPDPISLRRRILWLAVGMLPLPAFAQSLGTAFTYQGQLTESGQPANGLYDVQICVFDSPTNPNPLNCTTGANDVPVDEGVFTLTANFGSSVFMGLERFLELRVRPGASTGAFTTLAPRQLVRPTPEALRANVSSAAPWSGLTGVPTGFADGIDDTGNGSVTSITAGTGLSGGTITGSGTIGIASGGVTAVQLAVGAVGTPQLANGVVTSEKLASGAVGLAQINTTQVQARVSANCFLGEYLRGIAADGSPICTELQNQTRFTLGEPGGGSTSNTGALTSIAIGTDGLPVISYYDGNLANISVAKCANPACTGPATVTVVSSSSGDNGIAIGTDGRPIVSFRQGPVFSDGVLRVARCANANCTGSATLTAVDDPANNVGASTSIAIGSDGLPVISYQDETAGALKVAKCANTACTGSATITTVDNPTNFVGRDTSIAVASDGLPVISYLDTTAGALKVAKCANAACTGSATITTVDSSANFVGSFSSLAIGADGRPVISYYDDTATALKVARCANAACTGSATITTVDDQGDVGRDTSIQFGSDGLPVISYYDESSRALKVAKCANAACSGSATTITTVDAPITTNGRVGQWTSLAIGTDGLPVISYRSNDPAGVLKVAKCGTRSCQ